MSKISIRVPATTSNIGPGFDCLGMALNLYNTVEIEPANDKFHIEITGEYTDALYYPESNAVYQGLLAIYRKLEQPMPEFNIKLNNRIPVARGLGSSAAAYLSGLIAGNLFNGRIFSKTDILEMAVEYEKHPDNVVPALMGGLTVSCRTMKGTLWVKCRQYQIPNILLFIPELPMETIHKRKILPKTVSFDDAVFNITRSTLLITALIEGKWNLLSETMNDRIHQSYRDTNTKLFNRVIQTALDNGAYGAALSGSGSTILTFIPEANQAVATAVKKIFQSEQIPLRTIQLNIDTDGLVILD